jgi:hypothetical protein
MCARMTYEVLIALQHSHMELAVEHWLAIGKVGVPALHNHEKVVGLEVGPRDAFVWSCTGRVRKLDKWETNIGRHVEGGRGARVLSARVSPGSRSLGETSKGCSQVCDAMPPYGLPVVAIWHGCGLDVEVRWEATQRAGTPKRSAERAFPARGGHSSTGGSMAMGKAC